MEELKYPLLVSTCNLYFYIDETNNLLCYNNYDIIETIKRSHEFIIDVSIVKVDKDCLTYQYKEEWFKDDTDYNTREVRWEFINIK